ncbi:hypothetical protein CANCADRAFT_84819 [Tortispora caseinolytica NRRL Y-17796]|uniref:HMG box domain-containing protein n=1 Tax=Tortispora caseinolytica NRRL Y-17796 TaxID=767744 RepID=A0A1E4TKY0_9ASCO|nr:hypothetical protein CANCADRAFT_84819 [Tortispora caseinolytica NRRL Y-17796]
MLRVNTRVVHKGNTQKLNALHRHSVSKATVVCRYSNSTFALNIRNYSSDNDALIRLYKEKIASKIAKDRERALRSRERDRLQKAKTQGELDQIQQEHKTQGVTFKPSKFYVEPPLPKPPVRPRSSYQLYISCTDGGPFAENVDAAIQKWKSFSAAEKAQFAEMAEVDAQRFEKDFEDYIKIHGISVIRKFNYSRNKNIGDDTKKVRPFPVPKNFRFPRRPFNFYVKEQMDTGKYATVVEAIKALSSKWKEFTDAEKAPYVEMATKEREEFESKYGKPDKRQQFEDS